MRPLNHCKLMCVEYEPRTSLIICPKTKSEPKLSKNLFETVFPISFFPKLHVLPTYKLTGAPKVAKPCLLQRSLRQGRLQQPFGFPTDVLTETMGAELWGTRKPVKRFVAKMTWWKNWKQLDDFLTCWIKWMTSQNLLNTFEKNTNDTFLGGKKRNLKPTGLEKRKRKKRNWKPSLIACRQHPSNRFGGRVHVAGRWGPGCDWGLVLTAFNKCESRLLSFEVWKTPKRSAPRTHRDHVSTVAW